MRFFIAVISLLFMVTFWTSCRKDFEYAPSSGNLEFSRDTVYLDTIFTNIGSSTYALKVFNPTRDDVLIPSIRLRQGQASNYRMNVDGSAGKEFRDIPLLARDSLFIFVETTVNISVQGENTFLYTDVIEFDSGDFLQEVQLVTLVKDAEFLYPNSLPDGSTETIAVGFTPEGEEIRVEGFYLREDQLNLTNEKPYVIYGYAAVPENGTLVIDAGARVHFHQDSGIFVSNDASIQINGTLSQDDEVLENEVIFEGDRLEPEFSDIPGQWGAIWLAPGSVNNTIDHLIIKNATVGLLVEGDGLLLSPTLTLKNTQIYNSGSINLWARTAYIIAENTVLGTAGNSSLYCNAGGDYSFVHATIANYWTKGFREGTALQIDNFSSSGPGDLTRATFLNSIIDGNSNLELSLTTNGTHQFNFSFTNCILKFEDNTGNFDQNPLYNFEDMTTYENILLNGNVDFTAPNSFNFRIGERSEAINRGNLEAALTVPLDIKGSDRTQAPDIGAYEVDASE